METKQVNIVPPDGYEIDQENSTFECIKFKPIKRWRDNKNALIRGYFISATGPILEAKKALNNSIGYNIFATEAQCKSALAMARISQIMANDPRFGGVVADDEWRKNYTKYVIIRLNNKIYLNTSYTNWNFLAFYEAKQRDLFLEENEDLVKDYLMIL